MHAVIGITETLNLELRKVAPGVGATVLCPGLVATPLSVNSATLQPVGTETVVHKGGVDMSSFGLSLGEILTPEVVADAALAAIESDQVHVVPNKGIVPMVRARVESILAVLPNKPH
jgi:short-subunit dehydrogenase